MDFKTRLQKLFHTDKWWGKTIFVILTYAVFWCVFYGSWFLLPEDYFESHNISMNEWVFLFITVVLVPIISFLLLPRFIKKVFYIKNSFLYILHTIFILISLFLFFFLLITEALKNFSGFI